MISRRAECACGQLSATCSGDPSRVSICHCLACKRRTGSAFSYNAWFAVADVTVDGVAGEFDRVGDSGGNVTYGFCRACGSTVYCRLIARPDMVVISAGAFADLNFPAPTVSLGHDSRRCDWLEISVEGLETIR